MSVQVEYLNYTKLKRLKKELPKLAPDRDAEDIADWQAELSTLMHAALCQIHGTIPGLLDDESKSLLFWRYYFKCRPELRTLQRERRLVYLKATKARLAISSPLYAYYHALVSPRKKGEK